MIPSVEPDSHSVHELARLLYLRILSAEGFEHPLSEYTQGHDTGQDQYCVELREACLRSARHFYARPVTP